MNDDSRKEKLSRYLISLDRLKVKCRDTERWESLSLGPSGGIRVRSGGGQPDEIKEMAIQARQECEQQAVEVRTLRREMDQAFACMTTDRLRTLLECKYIEGLGDQDLCERQHFCDRHMRRLMTQAIHELDRCSAYFSESSPERSADVRE